MFCSFCKFDQPLTYITYISTVGPWQAYVQQIKLSRTVMFGSYLFRIEIMVLITQLPTLLWATKPKVSKCDQKRQHFALEKLSQFGGFPHSSKMWKNSSVLALGAVCKQYVSSMSAVCKGYVRAMYCLHTAPR